MILAGASGGIVAIIIATWAQVSGRDTGLVIILLVRIIVIKTDKFSTKYRQYYYYNASAPIQMRYRTESVNANEIANGVLSALVSITAGCPFVDYWGACLIGGTFCVSLIVHDSYPQAMHQ